MRRALVSMMAGCLVFAASSVTIAAESAETGTWFDGLEPGVCFNDAFDDDGDFDFTPPALIVACDQPHDNEVVARLSLGEGGFPTRDLIPEVDALCADAYEAFLGRPIATTLISPFSIAPDEDDWAAGATDALCSIYAGEAVVGSAASGALKAPGETLAVFHEVDTKPDIWIVDGGSGEAVRNVTDDELVEVVTSPSWTPDGKSVIYSVQVANDSSDVYVVSIEAGAPRPLIDSPAAEDGAVVSPDGSKIAFIADGDSFEYEIYSQDLVTGEFLRLTTWEDRDSSPAWSPDGERIAFRRRDADVSDIWVMNADGSDPVRLTENAGNNYDPRWSPDGSHIAFTTNRAGNFDIGIMSPDGSDQRLLTTHPADDEFPTWSSDGEILAFHSSRYGGVTLWLMRADGSDQSELTGLAPIGFAAFAPAPAPASEG